MNINSFQEFYNLIPLIVIAAGIVVSLVIELYFRNGKQILPWFTIVIFLASAFHSLYNIDNKNYLFDGMIAVGGPINVFFFIFCFGGALIVLNSIDYIKKYGADIGEYYILIQISVLGMMLMACAKDLIVIFLGLEVMSVTFYAIAGINRSNSKAVESSVKYFLLGAFATGFLVYGIALIYGSSASTNIDYISNNFHSFSKNLLFLAGSLLFLIGFSFKMAAFPFHQWVPDVYQGTSTTTASLFATIGKSSAFAAVIAFLSVILNTEEFSGLMPYFAAISILSMFYGAIVAIAQKNMKRMLAYSSIAHAGYLILGFAAGNIEGTSSIIFYLIAYTFTNLAAFGIVSYIEGYNEQHLELESYKGLANRNPLVAALLSIALFSLAGIPPFAGFFGKYYIFISIVKAGYVWLAILGVLASLISIFFYLRVIVYMYFNENKEEIYIQKSNTSLLAIIISVIFIILVGIFPNSVVALITSNF